MTPEEFNQILSEQIIVIDGAMGTMVQNYDLNAKSYGGEDFQMLSDILVFSCPDVVKEIHLEYFKAGANAVETNTFGASPLRLQEFDFNKLNPAGFPEQPDKADLRELSIEELTLRLNRQAVEIAKQALDEYKASKEYDQRPLFVLGSIGPSNWVLSSTHADLRKATFEQIVENFYCQVSGLIDGGVDVLLFETQQDILELKAAVIGAKRAMREKNRQVAIIAQVTVDKFTKMQIFNTDIHAAMVTIQDIGIDVFGINCSIGPDLMLPTVKKISRYSKLPISIIPNAGLPQSEDGKTVFKLTPEEMAAHIET
ncbi:MAG: homocysteine S-methyltransferase family protein, partial [Deltaproteobacteria bacterium]|nr:homocysteine S-methyltransferase family protein [Deltaproteobacteria bacterium]